jgi:hypothetical protein
MQNSKQHGEMQKLISLQADKYTMMKYESADCREHKDLKKEERVKAPSPQADVRQMKQW